MADQEEQPEEEQPQEEPAEVDEELVMRLGAMPDKVVIRFGKKVAWIGMTPDGARKMAQGLIEHAAIAEQAAAMLENEVQ